jgi:hypothetical protein
LRPSSADMTPICSPSAPMRRIDLARILSFTLVLSTVRLVLSNFIVHHLLVPLERAIRKIKKDGRMPSSHADSPREFNNPASNHPVARRGEKLWLLLLTSLCLFTVCISLAGMNSNTVAPPVSSRRRGRKSRSVAQYLEESIDLPRKNTIFCIVKLQFS